ncbi:TonB-linked SusC/RagA family outer membrane protein [Spirosoma lacussanchae]|uniref:SusC/RagA family TonB-linked outer membrane protein n=1 Tax=Spirosoma lacussanchae TaxID=1884249 RepID=UPI0011091F08|nr:TonB-dependent receptor [Spirosoma lacussanchae]
MKKTGTLLLTCIPLYLQAQDHPVQGTVRETKGVLPGVSVVIKGSSKGTQTAANGTYQLSAADRDTLVFSFIGYSSQEVAVGSRTTIDISLQEDNKQLSEVVVVGYGTQKKVNLTGAVDMVTSKDIQNRPITATSTGLQGLLPGVTIQNFQARPGQTGSAIRIRGIGTLNNANPLILIDGIEASLDNLNPDDIESVSVLKDAASAAIYGSRAANGVLLITTKQGKKDQKPTIGYSGYLGTQLPTRLPRFVDSPTYMTLLNESLANVGRPATFTADEIERARSGSDPNYYANTDWIRAIFRAQAPQQNHNFTVNGGAGATRYYLSYGYLDQQGLVVGDAFKAKRNNVRLRMTTDLLDRFQLDANVGYVDRLVAEPASGISEAGGLIYSAHQISPLVPERFTSGTWGYGGGSTNPVAVAYDGGTNTFSSQELTTNVSGTLTLTKGFRLRGQYGMVMANSRRNIYTGKISYFYPETGNYWYASSQYNSLDNRDYTNRYQSVIAQMDYEKQIGKHDIHLLLGYSQEWNRADYFQASRQALTSDDLEVLNNGTLNQLNSGDASHWALRSGFGRLNYVLAGKYLLEANVRYDGSSRFAKANRFGMFPSVSAGWRIGDEAFLQALKPVLSDAKIRVSWGMLGNQYNSLGGNIQYYPYLSPIQSVGTMPIGNMLTPAFAQTVLSNRDLRWETITMSNLGLDLQFWQGKLGVTADVFVKQTDNILVRVPLPDVLGFDEPLQNGGKVENRGWETSLNWRDQLGGFRYGLSANLSNVRNRVVSLGNVPPTYGDQIRQVGYPIDAFYGLVADGIAQTPDFTYDETRKVYTPTFPIFAEDAGRVAPGDVKYRDLNNDGKITLDGDRQVIGNPFPRYTYSLRSDLGWKGFDFSFFFQGVGQADGYIKGSARHAFITESAKPQAVHLDRWTPDNTDATYPRLTYQQAHNQRLSSFWLEKGAYLRLKNIQLGYTVPRSLVGKARIDRLRVYVSADNLFTATNYFYGYDPETPVSSGGYYPQVKTIVAGLNINLK